MAINALYLPDWTVTSVEHHKGHYVLNATYDLLPDACPKCGVVGRLYKHGAKIVDYVDAPVHGRPTTVRVTVQRFRCRECGATSMQPLPDMDSRRQMTVRAREYIEEQGMVRTYASVARDMHIEETTVRSICNDVIEAINASHKVTAPVVLGIDELTLLGHRRTIFTDTGERRVLDIAKDMTQTTVARWLSKLPDKDRIRIVTIDMWSAYRKAAYATLPGVIVIADKWHVQKTCAMALDGVRARIRAGIGQRRRGAHSARRLLHMSRHKLTPKREAVLEKALFTSPLLYDAWTCKEDFYDIWTAESRADAERMFEAWKTKIPDTLKEFAKVAKTIEDWREEVFAYFDHRYTNAYTEAANGLIKIASRAGRGYRFEAIRARALITSGDMPKMAVCEECLGQYPVTPIQSGRDVIHRINIAGHRERGDKVICQRCQHFHIMKWLTRHDRST